MTTPPAAPFTVSEADAAQRIGCTERWLANQARARKVPLVQVGRVRRYTPAQIGQIIDALTKAPAQPRGEVSAAPPRMAPRRRRAS